MAVELAKVSLWLDCFTLGAPLSFLDHHLRCGNSLVGVTVEEVNQSIPSGQLSLLSGTRFEGMKQAVAGMIRIGELSDVTSAQVSESRREYSKASEAMNRASACWTFIPANGLETRRSFPVTERRGRSTTVHLNFYVTLILKNGLKWDR